MVVLLIFSYYFVVDISLLVVVLLFLSSMKLLLVLLWLLHQFVFCCPLPFFLHACALIENLIDQARLSLPREEKVRSSVDRQRDKKIVRKSRIHPGTDLFICFSVRWVSTLLPMPGRMAGTKNQPKGEVMGLILVKCSPGFPDIPRSVVNSYLIVQLLLQLLEFSD